MTHGLTNFCRESCPPWHKNFPWCPDYKSRPELKRWWSTARSSIDVLPVERNEAVGIDRTTPSPP